MYASAEYYGERIAVKYTIGTEGTTRHSTLATIDKKEHTWQIRRSSALLLWRVGVRVFSQPTEIVSALQSAVSALQCANYVVWRINQRVCGSLAAVCLPSL